MSLVIGGKMFQHPSDGSEFHLVSAQIMVFQRKENCKLQSVVFIF